MKKLLAIILALALTAALAACTGTTAHAYVRQRRLLAAARLIRNGTPAGQAAAACGFGDYSSFCRAFRSAFGTRPSELK